MTDKSHLDEEEKNPTRPIPITVNYQNDKPPVGHIVPGPDFNTALGFGSNILAPAFKIIKSEIINGERIIREARLVELSIIPIQNHVDYPHPEKKTNGVVWNCKSPADKEEDNYWQCSCGWVSDSFAPQESGIKYCPHCGKEIIEFKQEDAE